MKATFHSLDYVLPNLSSGQVVHVRQGKTFDIATVAEQGDQEISGWFADEDPVLLVSASAEQGANSQRRTFRADTPGTSEIQIQGPKNALAGTRPLLFLLTVIVFSTEAQSATLTELADEPRTQ